MHAQRVTTKAANMLAEWLRGQGMSENANLVEELVADRDELAADLEKAQAKIFERRTKASDVSLIQTIKTSSPEFDAWFQSLGQNHPCSQCEGEADEFVIGDLVNAFEAGRASR